MRLLHKLSPYDVNTTIDRLDHAVRAAGATVFARIDHGKGARKSDLELRPTQLLIFGNPKLGTPFMQRSQAIGLNLPLRVVTYGDAEGQVHIQYRDIAELAADFGISHNDAVAKVAGVLEDLTDKAVATD